MTKKEFALFRIVGCISLLINNLAYLQQHVLAKIENPPMMEYQFGGIHEYNKRIMDDLSTLVKEINDD